MGDTELDKAVCVVGAGAAGLVSAQVLVADGFTHVDVLTRDHSPGGTWAEERIYPELRINNVHGEYRFSSLPMPPPADAAKSGGRLGGEDMRLYMESFADNFLKGRVQYDTVVTRIRSAGPDAPPDGKRWTVTVQDRNTGEERHLKYDKIVLCTGACSVPKYPPSLSPEDAQAAGFLGPVFHSIELKKNTNKLLNAVQPLTSPEPGHAVVVGGGKSAWDAAAFLANNGRKVTVVFETADAVVASSSPLPDFIRKSRLLSVLSPSPVLRTRLERFLHTTWLGSKLTHFFWHGLVQDSYKALGVPPDSPLRRAQSVFWGVRTNDEGVPAPDRFFSLVRAGKIALAAPARAVRFGADGRSVVLGDGRALRADAVVLATGFRSSWADILDEATYSELGLDAHAPPPEDADYRREFAYASLAHPPPARAPAGGAEPAAAVYRGIVPAKNILRRDFALNGAIFSTNNGYVYEVCAHWIASYLRGDAFLRVPPSAAAAVASAERNNAWLRVRFPGMFRYANESYAADMAMFGWPQLADTLLEDMGLPIMRSGGNWLTWPFKVADLREIARLKEERDAQRAAYAAKT